MSDFRNVYGVPQNIRKYAPHQKFSETLLYTIFYNYRWKEWSSEWRTYSEKIFMKVSHKPWLKYIMVHRISLERKQWGYNSMILVVRRNIASARCSTILFLTSKKIWKQLYFWMINEVHIHQPSLINTKEVIANPPDIVCNQPLPTTTNEKKRMHSTKKQLLQHYTPNDVASSQSGLWPKFSFPFFCSFCSMTNLGFQNA